MNVPNLEDLIGESEQDHVRVLEEEAREEHNRRAEESIRRYQERKGFEEYMIRPGPLPGGRPQRVTRSARALRSI